MWSLIKPNITSFDDLNSCFHATLIWGACGGLNDQSIRIEVAESPLKLLTNILVALMKASVLHSSLPDGWTYSEACEQDYSSL